MEEDWLSYRGGTPDEQGLSWATHRDRAGCCGRRGKGRLALRGHIRSCHSANACQRDPTARSETQTPLRPWGDLCCLLMTRVTLRG